MNLDTATYEGYNYGALCYKTDYYCTRGVDKVMEGPYVEVDLIPACPNDEKDPWCGEPIY